MNLLSFISSDFFLEDNSNLYLKQHLAYCSNTLVYRCFDLSKAINYRLFKDYFGMEVYFDILDNKNVVELFDKV
jgi:hypothetical protein